MTSIATTTTTTTTTTEISNTNKKTKGQTTSYPCNYKKERGIIVLHDDKITFVVQIIQQNQTDLIQTQQQLQSQTKMKLVLEIVWGDIKNHQVSPLTHAKKLLKLNLMRAQSPHPGASAKALSAVSVEFQQRIDLDRIRKDITNRLHVIRSTNATPVDESHPAQPDGNAPNKRVRLASLSESNTNTPTNFSKLDAHITAVTRSSILSTDPTIRAQHKLLVLDTTTLSEDDFWESHMIRLAQEAAKIHGRYRPGMGSMMRSNLDLQSESSNFNAPSVGAGKSSGKRCRIKLGVEEMRQIFILYPAVHRAYEEKVPLELSEEQFWRRYLESEYFHRDRGRIGMGVRNLLGNKSSTTLEKKKDGNNGATAKMSDHKNDASSSDPNKKDSEKEDDKKKQEQQQADDEARGSGAIVKGSEDIFSRYDVEMKQHGAQHANKNTPRTALRRGNTLAIGQFDLTSTYNTERSNIGLPSINTSDNNNKNIPSEDHYPSRVINKYNRHWAMVLNPDDATAGCDLTSVARKSITHSIPNDNIANSNGCSIKDFEKLVSFADSDPLDADHVKCVGMDYYDDGEGDSSMFTTLMIHDKLAYCGESLLGNKGSSASALQPNRLLRSQKDIYERNAVFAKATLAKVRPYFQISTHSSQETQPQIQASPLPPAVLGKELLHALTKKMADDDTNEYQVYKIIASLPDSFKKNLYSFFNRTSELLRHFFGLRQVLDNAQDKTLKEKTSRIVSSMEELYREMESIRKELPQTKEGEVMRKMCLPIMGQLDWAFKLNRDGSGLMMNGGGAGKSGGFVTVEEF